jgi:hypothetical protein
MTKTIVKKLSKSCQKIVKSCQKIVKKSKIGKKSCKNSETDLVITT